MPPRRPPVLAAVAALALAPLPARAVTLNEAIALALGHDPGLRRAQAEEAAARARLSQARAGRLPTVTVEGSVAEAPTNFGGFFGFGRRDLTPSVAAVQLRQPLFTGGAVSAAIGQAKAGAALAGAAYEAARLGLVADVAAAFEDVRVTQRAIALEQRQTQDLELVVQQAQRRFQDGAAPHTDVDQATARLAAARADLARAEGDEATASARYRTLVGVEPSGLETPAAPSGLPSDVNDAVAQAEAHNPALAGARASVAAAERGVSKARADAAPTIALVAGVSTTRDEFLPGYRADGASIGVQGRWALFDGAHAGRVAEAAADRVAAEASLDQAREQTDEAAIEAWHAFNTAEAVARAAADQANAADAALANVREEVRVGEKPTLELLDAEREALSARIGVLRADAATVVAAYRLLAVVGA